MAAKRSSSSHAIVLTREAGGWQAGIAELCIRESAATAEAALAAALRAEADVRKGLAAAGAPPPPTAEALDPYPAASRVFGRYFAFFRQVLIGYAFVACITAVLVALLIPTLRLRAEQYVNGGQFAVDGGKLLTKLGAAVCAERR